MKLTISNIRAETIPTGEKVSGFEIVKTKDLQLLHETIMNKLSPYITYNVSLDMIYALPNQQVEEVTTYWIKNYPKESSFENFSPHITIGFGEVEGETSGLKFPIKFNAPKLALCHFGNYCTCRKIVLLHELKMKNKSPLVSVGMPVYNGEKYIMQALDSLLGQTYKNFELIISDNASEDATQQICLEYVSKDKGIRYYRNETNLGAAKNFNKVFELSRGKYFMWAGDHDLWDKTFISRCVEIMKEEPSVVICYPQTMLIDLEGNELEITPDCLDTRFLTDPSQRFHQTIWELSWCNIIYGLIRSSSLRQTRLFVNVIGTDHLLLAELSLIGTFVQIPLPLFYRRINCPNEDNEQALKRRLKEISPNMNATIPFTLLMFNHLIAVKNAPINFKDKIKLMKDVFYCFSSRFGVLNELLCACHLMGICRKVKNIGSLLLLYLGVRR